MAIAAFGPAVIQACSSSSFFERADTPAAEKRIPYGHDLGCRVTDSANPPFIILGMPRCRTYWLSKFLSYGQWTCGHEEGRYLRTLADAKSWLTQDRVGTAETAVAPYWRLIKKMRPDVRIITVRRPVQEAVESFIAGSGAEHLRDKLTAIFTRIAAKLTQIEKRVPGVVSLTFADLANEETCAALFEYCLGYKHDHDWWEAHDKTNLQMNLPALMQYMAVYAPQLRTISSVAAQESKKQMWAGRPIQDRDGMTFEEVSFREWLTEGQHLIQQHHTDCGQASDNFNVKNLPLFERLDQNGALQTVVAKSNGRMFGYLVTVIGESFEDPKAKVAVQTAFFRSPDAPGLGSRLIKASIGFLEERGGRWEIIQRAGVRASGPTLGRLYTRMGAEPDGEIYKITVGSDQ